MKRFETIARNFRMSFYKKLKEAHEAGATAKELGKLIGLSEGTVKKIIYRKDLN